MVQQPEFGLFNKTHKEFFNALDQTGWTPVAGYTGVEEKILSGRLDPSAKTGAVTRLSRWAPGAAVTEPVQHDWCEEIYLISGTLSVGLAGQDTEVLAPGTYAVRPPHILHGPFFTVDGCLMIEFMYYPPRDLR